MQRKLFLDFADLYQLLIPLAFLKIASWPPIAVCLELRHDILANLCEYIFAYLTVIAHGPIQLENVACVPGGFVENGVLCE